MKKLIAGAALAAAIVGIGGTAFAGEINGNGEPHADQRVPGRVDLLVLRAE